MEINSLFNFESEDLEDIELCLKCLYGTRKGSMPMDRDFGIDYVGITDLPMELAQNQLALNIIEQTEKYEPRVAVTEVTFESDVKTGTLRAYVHLEKNEEEDEDE